MPKRQRQTKLSWGHAAGSVARTAWDHRHHAKRAYDHWKKLTFSKPVSSHRPSRKAYHSSASKGSSGTALWAHKGTGGYYSTFHKVNHAGAKAKALKVKDANYFYAVFGSDRANGVIGQLYPYIAATFATCAELTTQIAAIISETPPVGGVGGDGADRKQFLHKCVNTLVLTNVANTTAELYLLNITAKVDQAAAFQTDPRIAWQNGIDEEGGSSTSYLNYDQILTIPQQFKTYFRIDGNKRVFLTPGETYKHTSTIAYNKYICLNDIENRTYKAGLTSFVMIIQQGGQITNGVGFTGALLESTCSTAVNFINKSQYSWKKVAQPSQSTMQFSTLLPTSYSAAENVENVDTAAAVTKAAA